ncbi:iron complex transport system substrate-binding protein [Halopseudomonas xinjiangensis]|uniref:Iron complex transport system substrate-binding protein n=1 Tax=Halopseudomonas xinjiangensis TaxID=487184 RepID=A0A1H1S9Y1_9GAMM|nr:cobalamin-binding protein [Halopseudomonas xinjiangensis]SDS44693.1 iron complex transport system substrate-binding protein [Halopseudomonas xinjiangensis]
MKGPQRIVCLSTETCEVLYRLGEQDRIAGISGFTVHPPQARREKPKVSAFTSAKTERIIELKPDLVLGYCDLQAGIAADLAREGLEVHLFNQRDIAGILRMIETLGALVGAGERAAELVQGLQERLDQVRQQSSSLPCRPRVYFEEWNDPLISGIRWVSELIDIAGGEDCFADLSHHPRARDRYITEPMEVVRRAPDLIIGSWCGKRFRPEQLAERDGWRSIPAIRSGDVHEIKSPDILQPGISALTLGLDELQRLIRNCAERMR